MFDYPMNQANKTIIYTGTRYLVRIPPQKNGALTERSPYYELPSHQEEQQIKKNHAVNFLQKQPSYMAKIKKIIRLMGLWIARVIVFFCPFLDYTLLSSLRFVYEDMRKSTLLSYSLFSSSLPPIYDLLSWSTVIITLYLIILILQTNWSINLWLFESLFLTPVGLTSVTIGFSLALLFNVFNAANFSIKTVATSIFYSSLLCTGQALLQFALFSAPLLPLTHALTHGLELVTNRVFPLLTRVQTPLFYCFLASLVLLVIVHKMNARVNFDKKWETTSFFFGKNNEINNEDNSRDYALTQDNSYGKQVR